ncbi:unnamed protein product [Clonostachys solani]|uniref:GIT Spa2 homology (SHD) domain-containing protein n=1 Tax=Clonostachys solani TaxID=160281 RepID=A0A9N9ZJH8_9HYPO|nr:unnamed protein product [Clonostachys solani]
MSISGRNAPLSPVSVGGSEWPTAKYHDDRPFLNNRGNLASPPSSGGSNSAKSINGYSPGGPRSNGGPSPPASVGRSSMGTAIYARSESGRNSTLNSPRNELQDEATMSEHYRALKLFLMHRDPNNKGPLNKARDKLLRLSFDQFFELSTDVYDELTRRQAAARVPPDAPNAPPRFLVAEEGFHPKRNQARQRLSSLGPPRFRDLIQDVCHELERRFPRFVGVAIPRGNSGMSMRSPPVGPPNGYGHPPRGQSLSRMRQPSDAGSIRGPPPLDVYGVPPSPVLPGGQMGRPMPKQLNQSNTIVPNKSTMVEEDDEGEAAGSEQENKGRSETSEADKKLIADYQSQVQELKEKIENMEAEAKKKDSELETERSQASRASAEKAEWDDLRTGLENKLAEARNLNESMKYELEKMREDQEDETNHLRNQITELQQNSTASKADNTLLEENRTLRETTEQVRQEAQGFLREMRILSEKSNANYEKQLELERSVEQLEHDVREWKGLYARAKTQLGDMRAPSNGLTPDHQAGSMVREKGFVDEVGMVKDLHVTKFQISIDELMQRARNDNPERVIDAMKSVVVNVRRITKDIDQATPNSDDFAEQKPKLKGRISTTANNLITASKNFANGAGLSPVSLLDAAASNLTAAIVELLRVVKIRPTPADELEEDDEGSVTPVESTGFFSPRSTTHISSPRGEFPPPPPFQGLGGLRGSADSSAYSPITSPRESVDPNSARGGAGMGYPGMKGY